MMTFELTGIIPPLTTPFDAEGAIDLDGLRRNLARYEDARSGDQRLGGYLLFGSNGEAVHLDPGERDTVLEAVRSALPAGRMLIAGVNANATREAIAAVRQAADQGADAALVITPYFYRGAMSQDVLERFFNDVADASSLPLLVYNIPQNTGVRVAPATLARLARHPRIVGTKDSSGDFGMLAETVRRVPDDFRVFVGNAGILQPALEAGAAGGILAVACALPDACIELFAAARDGDHDIARSIQRRVAPIGRLLTTELGIPGLKAALDLVGLVGGNPRPPLHALDATARGKIARALRNHGF